MATGARREFLISKAWFQAAILSLFGFFVLGLLTYRTCRHSRRCRDASWAQTATSCSPVRTSAAASRCSCTTG